MIGAITFIACVALAIVCVAVFGIVFGPLVWLLGYWLFTITSRALLRRVDTSQIHAIETTPQASDEVSPSSSRPRRPPSRTAAPF